MEKRIERLLDGILRPTCYHPPRLTSAHAPWSGFLMERGPCLEGGANSVVWPHTELVMVISGGIQVESCTFGAKRRFFAEAGSVTIWPAGHESRSASWTPADLHQGSTEKISVQLDLSIIKQLGLEIDVRQISMQSAVQDVVLTSLVRLIEADVQTGCPTGRLYGELLSQTLALHVLGRYGVDSKKERPLRARLSGRQREQVREYVRTNLDGDLSLAELARVAGLSPQHFMASFRNTFETTPHQYILRERINQAKRLLTAKLMPIADVAATVGFATQSHFTLVFRKVTGVTPRGYRAAL